MGVGDGVGGYLMTLSVQILNMTIVSPLMGDVESSSRWASIGICTIIKQSLVEVFIQDID